MFERHWTALNVGAGAAAEAFDLNLPDQAPELELECWQSNQGNNLAAFIFENDLSVTEAGQRTNFNQPVDMLCAVPNAGIAKVGIDPDLRRITVYFPMGSNAMQAVSIRVRERNKRD